MTDFSFLPSVASIGGPTPVKKSAQTKSQLRIRVTRRDLEQAAAQVGSIETLLSGVHGRDAIEVNWRSYSILAALIPGVTGWHRSDFRFRWMDPSEKRFLSYMLGSVQAQLMCNKVLKYDFLVHVDVLVKEKLIDRPPAPKPDFVAFNGGTSTAVAFVEAKGRTSRNRGYSFEELCKTKNQASTGQSAPGVPIGVGTATWAKSVENIVSIASFDGGGRWQSQLHDPPETDSSWLPSKTTLMYGYYLPLVRAMKALGVSDVENPEEFPEGEVQGQPVEWVKSDFIFSLVAADVEEPDEESRSETPDAAEGEAAEKLWPRDFSIIMPKDIFKIVSVLSGSEELRNDGALPREGIPQDEVSSREEFIAEAMVRTSQIQEVFTAVGAVGPPDLVVVHLLEKH